VGGRRPLRVATQGSAAFAAGAPGGVVSVREWPGLFHEIFNEPEQGDVLKVLDDWLARKLPQAGAVSGSVASGRRVETCPIKAQGTARVDPRRASATQSGRVLT
jgi:hypothetical protein